MAAADNARRPRTVRARDARDARHLQRDCVLGGNAGRRIRLPARLLRLLAARVHLLPHPGCVLRRDGVVDDGQRLLAVRCHRAQRRGGTPADARADGDLRGGRSVVFNCQPSKSSQGVRPAAAERAGFGGGVSRSRAAARRRARARSVSTEPRADGGRGHRGTAQEPARSGRLSANGSHWTVSRRARARLQQPVGGGQRQCGTRSPGRGAARRGACVPARDPRRGEARFVAVARPAHVQPTPGDGVPIARPGRHRRPSGGLVADGGRNRCTTRGESRR